MRKGKELMRGSGINRNESDDGSRKGKSKKKVKAGKCDTMKNVTVWDFRYSFLVTFRSSLLFPRP